MTGQKNSVDKVKTDPFGFGFWLGWILWFAGALIVAAIVWTALLVLFFGRLEGNELYATWAVSVFGSWFVIVIPFMRKKERIWKRLNVDEERATSVWLRAMGLFIGLLISSAFLWSFLMRDKIFLDPGFHPEWLKAVISTWGILLIPFLIFIVIGLLTARFSFFMKLLICFGFFSSSDPAPVLMTFQAGQPQLMSIISNLFSTNFAALTTSSTELPKS